ncbi:MAG: PEP-CTERM sorting domain-containing protein [Akkermansiaceae bacterium]|nr:PEP-CTERM sorting domain-containing protein [Akkermansiaceae bacterium]
MKKTLITLLALAGVAAAEYNTKQLWSLDLSNGSYSSTDYAASFNFNTEWSSTDFTTMSGYVSNSSGKISMENGTKDAGLLQGSSFIVTMNCSLTSVPAGTLVGTLIDLEQSNDKHLYVSYDTSNSTITLGGNYTLSNLKTEGTYTLSDITSITLCYENITSTTANLSVYVGTADEYSLAATAGVSGLNDAHFFKSVGLLNKMNESEKVIGGVSSVSAYAIVPEPATATLSLLALAGLAARRRRR